MTGGGHDGADGGADFKEKLRRDHVELAARYEQFGTEHVSAVEQTRTCSTRRGA